MARDAALARRCAFLTMDNTEGWSIDADLAVPMLEARNWSVDWMPWRSGNAAWDAYDAVYIGVPWDYPQDPVLFLEVLDRIDRSRAVLVNDLALVRWSMAKTYLRDLEARGADIVPSLWYDRMQAGDVAEMFDRLRSAQLVVKPVVSTNATDTFRLLRGAYDEPALLRKFGNREFVAQPFIENICSEGEYSLFYFGGAYSHAIVKVPKDRDFRVQEEHGADIRGTEPEPALIDCANRVLQLVEPVPVYARGDFVRGADGRFLLMELELVEPSMYLRMHADAPRRFAEAFDRYVSSAGRKDGSFARGGDL